MGGESPRAVWHCSKEDELVDHEILIFWGETLMLINIDFRDILDFCDMHVHFDVQL